MRRDNLLHDSIAPIDDATSTPSLRNDTDAHIEGLRVEKADREPTHTEEGIPQILVGTKVVIRLFGTGITNDTLITFTDMPAERGTICDKIKSDEFKVSITELIVAAEQHGVAETQRTKFIKAVTIIKTYRFRWKMSKVVRQLSTWFFLQDHRFIYA